MSSVLLSPSISTMASTASPSMALTERLSVVIRSLLPRSVQSARQIWRGADGVGGGGERGVSTACCVLPSCRHTRHNFNPRCDAAWKPGSPLPPRVFHQTSPAFVGVRTSTQPSDRMLLTDTFSVRSAVFPRRICPTLAPAMGPRSFFFRLSDVMLGFCSSAVAIAKSPFGPISARGGADKRQGARQPQRAPLSSSSRAARSAPPAGFERRSGGARRDAETRGRSLQFLMSNTSIFALRSVGAKACRSSSSIGRVMHSERIFTSGWSSSALSCGFAGFGGRLGPKLRLS